MLDIFNASGLGVSYELRSRRQASDPVPGRPKLFILKTKNPRSPRLPGVLLSLIAAEASARHLIPSRTPWRVLMNIVYATFTPK
jgi:hypothetical protein